MFNFQKWFKFFLSTNNFCTDVYFYFSYYDQLVAIDKKIPVSEVQIPFKWKDAFDKGSIFGGRISLTVPSFAYERVCVLFNMGALSSLIGKYILRKMPLK